VSAYSRRDNHKTDEIRADDFASPDQKIQDEQPGKEASKNREEAMVRLSALASLLLSLVILSSATCVPLAKEVEVNGVRLQYLEQGSGEPVVFVHGAISDLRTWPPAVSETVAKKYRFIAYTQRYHGTGPWNDDGRKYSVATHADDLAKFISALNVGPAHVVGWSYGGWVAIIAAQNTPSLVRSLILYEGGPPSVLAPDSPEAKTAAEDRAKFTALAMAALKAGDAMQAAGLFFEAVYQIPSGGFERQPEAIRTTVLDNARTLPALFASPPSGITCESLKNLTQPTLVLQGEKTQTYYVLINEAISRCVPNAQRVILPNVNHVGPARDPAGFSAVVLDFLSKHPGL
jgi:pimeloyl-ACP methyl ester carboxylesterase